MLNLIVHLYFWRYLLFVGASGGLGDSKGEILYFLCARKLVCILDWLPLFGISDFTNFVKVLYVIDFDDIWLFWVGEKSAPLVHDGWGIIDFSNKGSLPLIFFLRADDIVVSWPIEEYVVVFPSLRVHDLLEILRVNHHYSDFEVEQLGHRVKLNSL